MNNTVLVRDDDEIRVITLNRPERLNAINPALLDSLNAALEVGNSDPSIRGMVLAGAGRAFCAGDDLLEQQSMTDCDETEIRAFVDAIQRVTRLIMYGDTPVVAAVHGWAVGGAFSWPINCDLSIWADDARGFFPEIGIGLFVSGAVTYLLPLEVGFEKAREMIYLGGKHKAPDLQSLGLVSEVVPRAAVLTTAIHRTRALARLPIHPRTALKRAFIAAHREAIEGALKLEAEAVVHCLLDPETYTRIARDSDRGSGST